MTGRFGRLNRTIRAANPYFAANFKNALAAVNAGLPGEVQAAQETLQAASGPVQSAVAQAGTTGASAEAAAGRLADASSTQLASEQAAVAQFWDRYYSSFNPLRAEMAAIASAELPPSTSGAASSAARRGIAAARARITGSTARAPGP